MSLPQVIDLSSDEDDCMDDTAADVCGHETSFPGSDNGKRKDYCVTETVKQELFEQPSNALDSADGSTFIMPAKKQVRNIIAQSDQRGPMQTSHRDSHNANSVFSPYPVQTGVCRQFWKAGDYDVRSSSKRTSQNGMDHVRVHPKFLHSNATSHKWALGAIAELLDNAVDEIQNGATFVNVDKITNPRDNTPALLFQDDGGGMDPDCMRQCMSLGYSRKNTNTTIGQYGNGFKTSTMRLGADVVVFSCCNLTSVSTQSIGLLSYTFLRETGHEDIIVPMVDYELSFSGQCKRLIRSTAEDWAQNLSTLLQWSPYSTEVDLLKQFDDIGPHGTKVIVYNLWLNDDGQIELDFESDKQDIALRGGPKVDKIDVANKQQLSEQHISNRLRYSLRLYASILYLELPSHFKIILRGRVVEHHTIAADLKFPEFILYKPQVGGSKEVSVVTTIGFTKEAPLVNVHGFNVYHKNRLIMPFWRVFHENSSRGRGVVGVLEANFIEPAHDKQDFERTAVLLRLETRLKQMTIEYWNLHCALIGYQPSNAKPIKPRNVPSNTSGPTSGHPVGPTSNNPAGPYEAVRQSVSNSSTPLSEMASPSPNFVPIPADVDTKPAALRPGVINPPHLSDSVPTNFRNDSKHSLSRIPSVRGTSPNTSTSEETPSGTINSSLSVPLGRGVNATASAPSTPPQQFSDLEDFTSNQFRCQNNGWTARRREEINGAQDSGLGKIEDSASSPLVSNNQREHQTSNGPLSSLANGCASTISKTKRKISELISSDELESPKRRALETVSGSANDDHLNIQSMSDDAEIGSIPMTEQPNLSKDKSVNCQEVEEFLEENRKLQSQCVEYEIKERELEERVRELENELLEIQREYAKLLIESQSLSTVKEET